jgi:hypothetical protein
LIQSRSVQRTWLVVEEVLRLCRFANVAPAEGYFVRDAKIIRQRHSRFFSSETLQIRQGENMPKGFLRRSGDVIAHNIASAIVGEF